MAAVLIVALLVAGTGAPQAQTSELRQLDTEQSARVWRAVGRIDFGHGSFCSGTLIAPNLVLTAAHCLYKPDTSELWPAGQIVFRAGYRDGQAAAVRRISDLAAHEGFRPASQMDQQNISHDVGLLRLAEPISTYDVPPFYLSSGPVAAGPVSVVSYGRGRADLQSRQKECQLIKRISDAMLFDCDVTFGSSGAPVFSHANGRGQIISVISGMLHIDGAKHSVGMYLPDRITELKRQMRMQVALPAAQVRRLRVGDDNSGLGAKFVRPGGS